MAPVVFRMQFDFSPKGVLAIHHLHYKWLWLGIGLAMVATVFVLSIVSVPSAVKSFMVQDKVMHMVAYATLMGWFAQIYRHDLTRLVLVLGFIAMGIGIEFLQGMTATRHFEVIDMVANTSGVVLAWALAYTWVGEVLPWLEKRFNRLVLRH